MKVTGAIRESINKY